MSIYGLFTGAVYFTPIIGGYLSDRYLGRRLAITMGGITMAVGNFLLFAVQSTTGLYLGLVLLIIGNGFFKPNISTLVGELYPENDKRRDAAFTIFYMGINVGALFAPLICGYLAEEHFKTALDGVEMYGFKYGFLAAAIGMVIGQIAFNLLGNRYLGISANSRSERVKLRGSRKPPIGRSPRRRSKEPPSSSFWPVLSSFSGQDLNRRGAL